MWVQSKSDDGVDFLTVLNRKKRASTPGSGSSGVPIKQHSSFKPNKTNFQRKTGGRLILTIREGEVYYSSISSLLLFPHDLR